MSKLNTIPIDNNKCFICNKKIKFTMVPGTTNVCGNCCTAVGYSYNNGAGFYFYTNYNKEDTLSTIGKTLLNYKKKYDKNKNLSRKDVADIIVEKLSGSTLVSGDYVISSLTGDEFEEELVFFPYYKENLYEYETDIINLLKRLDKNEFTVKTNNIKCIDDLFYTVDVTHKTSKHKITLCFYTQNMSSYISDTDMEKVYWDNEAGEYGSIDETNNTFNDCNHKDTVDYIHNICNRKYNYCGKDIESFKNSEFYKYISNKNFKLISEKDKKMATKYIPKTQLKKGDLVELELHYDGEVAKRKAVVMLEGRSPLFFLEEEYEDYDSCSYSMDDGGYSASQQEDFCKIIEDNGWDAESSNLWESDKNTKVIKVLSSKNKKLDSSNSTVLEKVKSDFVAASYRVASTQFTKAIKNGIMLALKDKGVEEGKISVIKDLLETEFGNAIISSVLGYGLTYVPGLKDDPRIAKLSDEFRIQGMTTVGNEVMGVAMQYFLPAMQDVLSALPALPSSKLTEEKVLVEEVLSKSKRN